MNAEEKLAQWYIDCAPEEDYPGSSLLGEGESCIRVTKSSGGVYIAPEHIDLIANLVVERLKQVKKEGQ